MKKELQLLFVFWLLFVTASLQAQDIIIEDGSIQQCSGIFYDSGGLDEDYNDDDNYTFTICPEEDGDFIALDFTAFELGENSTLTIYNSNNTDGEVFAEFTGTTSPGEIKATTEALTETTSATGCLTIVFEANGDVGPGWEAEVSCISNDVFYDQPQSTGVYTQCTGMFYDNGGPNNGYIDSGVQVFTFCSDDPDLVTQLVFTQFLTSANDVMSIYDGSSTSAPLIGEYNAGISPGTVMASALNESGCLTIEFAPDGIPSPVFGWQAQINCVEPCQLIELEELTVEPSLPGTNGANYDVAVNEAIDFVADVSFEESGEDATYEWNFDDGTTADGLEVTHTFNSEGSYSVELTITDSEGCPLVIEFEVQVQFYAVEVDQNTYTVPELVENVLINNDCAQISNITWRSGNAQGTNNGIGYFNYNNSSFPMEEGVVLYSGNVNEVPGPETGTQSSGGWNGDSDLDDLIDEIEGNGPASNDATLIEFDFLTFADEISFNFLFSSDEYGGFQCQYSDPFGFFLTDEDGNTQNIALVPGTTTPVAVTTVRNPDFDCLSGGPCGSIPPNPQFFDTYFGNGCGNVGADPNTAPINSRGYTKIMTANSAVIPGETYHIKLVIGDRGDSSYNSAVFLEAGSFNIGEIDLGGDIAETSPRAECLGDVVILDLDLTIIEGVEITWYKDGVLIPGENGTTLQVTEPGDYTAEFVYDPDGDGVSDCANEDTVTVEFLPTPIVDGQAPNDLFACTSGGESQNFDLLELNEQVLNGQDPEDFEITYYESSEAAEDRVNPITNPEEYEVSPDCMDLFVRIEGVVEGNFTECYSVYQFEVCVGDLNVGTTEDLYACDLDDDGIGEFDLTENDEAALEGLSNPDLFQVTYYESQENAEEGIDPITEPTTYENVNNNPQEIFVRIENTEDEDCVATNGSFFVEALTSNAYEVEDMEDCGNGVDAVFFDLSQNTPQALGEQTTDNYIINYFESEEDAENNEDEITNTSNYPLVDNGEYEIYIRVDNNLLEECYNITSFTVTLNTVTIGDLSNSNLESCDGDNDGDGEFDLTQNNAVVLDGQEASDYTVTYYDSQASADAGQSEAIPNPTNYSNVLSNPQEVFVRVESNNNSNCYETGSFFIESFESGAANEPNDLYLCDNGVSGNTVDLTVNTPVVLGDQSLDDFNIRYYETLASADLGGAGITNTTSYEPLEDGQEIFVRIENAERPNCYNTTVFEIEVATVVIGEVSDKEECDNGNTGEATFDLTQSNIEALAGQSAGSYTVSYYAGESSLDNDSPILDPTSYVNGSNPEEIFFKVSPNSSPGCYLTSSFMIEATPSAEIFDPSPLIACDNDNDGIHTQFMLTDRDQEVTGGNDGVSVSYHPTQLDAENGVNAFESPYANVSPYNQTVYVRAVDNTNGCVQTTTLELEVYDRPVIVEPEGLSVCDENSDGQAYFDLTTVSEEVLDGLDPGVYQVSYHSSEVDALAGSPSIPGPGGYLSTGGEVWVRVEDTGTPTGCHSVVPLLLEVAPLPEPVQPSPLESCDDLASGSDTDGRSIFDLTSKEGELTGGNNAWTVLWYEDQASLDAGDPIAVPSAYTNTNEVDYAQQTLLAEVTGPNGCSAVTTLTLTVNPLPSPTPSADLEVYQECDSDNDGFSEFDLESLETLIANGEDNVEITYHPTASSADLGVDAITDVSNYGNTNPWEQVIYARSTNTITGCHRYVSLTLEVVPLPEIDMASGDLDLFICDGNGDGNAFFDLTQNSGAIYGAQSPDDYQLGYYESLEGAEAGGGLDLIGTPTAYPNQGESPLTVWVRLEDIATGCYRTASFELEVGVDPLIMNPTGLFACDDSAQGPTDGIGLFDLTEATPEVTGGDSTLSVSYYASESDRDADIPIEDPSAYEVDADEPVTVYLTVTGGNSCTSHTNLTLTVTPNPSIAEELPAIEQCDEDNDGVVAFDLSAATDGILNGEDGVSITYHTTLSNAKLGVDAIEDESSYTTVNDDSQTIYVRAENDETGCYTVRALELVTIASPEIQGELEDLYICDGDDNNGIGVFDLTENEDNIFGDADTSNLEITYHTSEGGAISGTGAIAVPTHYTNEFNGQVIYVRLANTQTGCIDGFFLPGDNSFTLNVNSLPELTHPSGLQLCNQDDSGEPYPMEVFDLTVKEEEIFGGPVPSDFSFSYYAGEPDYQAGVAIADPTAYENEENPQTIYVEVTHNVGEGEGSTACSAVETLTITVLPMPSPSETDPDVLRMTACDDTNDGVAQSPFDLTLNGDLISQGEPVQVSYYRTAEAAENEDAVELIGDPGAYVNEPSYNEVDASGNPTNVQVIYARVDSDIPGNFCYVVVPFELVVQPAPVLNTSVDGLDFGYSLCSDNAGSGTGSFYAEDVAGSVYDYDDVTFNPGILVPLLDPGTATNGSIGDYTVSIHFTADGAVNGTGEVPPGYIASDGDVFYIQLTHDLTGCGITDQALIGVLHIKVEPRPGIAEDAVLSIMACSDNEGGNTATVDLQDFDGAIDNNGTPNTEVYYYASETDYENGVRIAATDEPAYLASDGDVIYAEVVDTTTYCNSTGVVMIPVSVGTRPSVDISSYNGMYICSDSDPSTPVDGGDYTPLVIDTGMDGEGYTFEWRYNDILIAGEDGPSISVGGGSGNPLQDGEYSVIAFDLNTIDGTGGNCGSNPDTIVILGSNPPEFEVAPTSIGFEGEHSLRVYNVSGNGDYEFSVDNGPWSVMPSSGILDFDGLSAGVHTVYGRDRNGCGTTESRAVSFIDFPPFFTPNGDGYNDTWNIIGLDTDLNRGARIYIFDRYGKLLKQLSPSSPGWDGTYNGSPLPSGDYWFSVEYLEPGVPTASGAIGVPRPTTFKNHFTMKR